MGESKELSEPVIVGKTYVRFEKNAKKVPRVGACRSLQWDNSFSIVPNSIFYLITDNPNYYHVEKRSCSFSISETVVPPKL